MIYLIAISKARADHIDDLRRSLSGLIEPTRAETGCVLYDLHESTENPGEFLFYEIWDSQAHLDAHAKSEHLSAHQRRSADWIETARLMPMKKLG